MRSLNNNNYNHSQYGCDRENMSPIKCDICADMCETYIEILMPKVRGKNDLNNENY